MSVVCHAHLRAGRFVCALLVSLNLVACGADSTNPTPTSPSNTIVVHLVETAPVKPTEIISVTATPALAEATANTNNAATPTSDAPLAQAVPNTIVGVIKPDASGLRLRERPSADGKIILFIDAGVQLRISQRSTDGVWLRAAMPDGTAGYVMTQFVQLNTDITSLGAFDAATTGSLAAVLPTKTAEPTSVANPTNALIAIVKPDATGLRLREQPSNDGKVIVYLNAGVRLRVLEQSADGIWMTVTLPDGTRGYVMAQFVQMSSVVAITPLAAPVVASSVSLKQNLIGSWQLTQDSLGAWPQAPTPQPGITQIQLIDGLSKQVTFRSDGTFLTFGTGGAQGQYEILDDSRFVIDLNPANVIQLPGTRITYEVTFKGNSLTLKAASGRVTTWTK